MNEIFLVGKCCIFGGKCCIFGSKYCIFGSKYCPQSVRLRGVVDMGGFVEFGSAGFRCSFMYESARLECILLVFGFEILVENLVELCKL